LATGIPTRLSRADGRKFGFSVGGAFLVLAALLYVWRHKATLGASFAVLGALLVLAALVAPTALGPVERAWMGLARVLSRVTTPIFMGVVFFVVVTPIGWIMRLVGRRPMVHAEREGSFWGDPPSGGRSDMEHQF
jgi:Saxitoxin biosynthesis operon protein SxtJ